MLTSSRALYDFTGIALERTAHAVVDHLHDPLRREPLGHRLRPARAGRDLDADVRRRRHSRDRATASRRSLPARPPPTSRPHCRRSTAHGGRHRHRRRRRPVHGHLRRNARRLDFTSSPARRSRRRSAARAEADASASVTVATVRTARRRRTSRSSRPSTSQAPWARSSLHFVLAELGGRAAGRRDRAASRSTASVADMISALSAVLNPNNINPALPFTDNVAVRKHGTIFTITFRAPSRQVDRVSPVLDPSHPVTIATRVSGIDYYGVETLDITLGGGNDVFNVQGTSRERHEPAHRPRRRQLLRRLAARTSPRADRPDFITGTLAGIKGTLNIDGGGGPPDADDQRRGLDRVAHRRPPDAQLHDALGKDSRLTANADSTSSASRRRHLLLGRRGGDFAGGITIWTGFGDDRIYVEGTPKRDRRQRGHDAQHRPRQRQRHGHARLRARRRVRAERAGPVQPPVLPDQPGDRPASRHHLVGLGRRLQHGCRHGLDRGRPIRRASTCCRAAPSSSSPVATASSASPPASPARRTRS